ncbi:MAG: hypothetical protein HYS61_01250 [Acidobacteria bacterium]|nr:hypothetical protein [Acidobacteriota bacterium]
MFLTLFFAALSARDLMPQEGGEEIEDITGKYEFLGPHDTLALLEDAGRLNGYIDVFQEEEESDDVLSYRITLGSRQDRRLEIKTATIHRRYYRFKGAVERGKSREKSKPDYLRLVGELENVTIEGDSGEETVQKTHVVLKSLGESADEDAADDE